MGDWTGRQNQMHFRVKITVPKNYKEEKRLRGYKD